MGFTFQTTPSLLVEAGGSRKIGEIFSRLGCRTVLVVTDRGIVDAGLLAPALAGLDAAGVGHTLFTDVRADPPEPVVEAAVKAVRAAGADGVLGLGGGSSLDVAKLAALLASGRERLDEVYGVGVAKGPRLPLVLAPTTAGTGSEVTPIAIVTTRREEKKGVVSPPLLPDCATKSGSSATTRIKPRPLATLFTSTSSVPRRARRHWRNPSVVHSSRFKWAIRNRMR